MGGACRGGPQLASRSLAQPQLLNEGGTKGRVLLVQEFAQSHLVKAAALTVLANERNYRSIIDKCSPSYLMASTFFVCKDDAGVQNLAGPKTL